MKRDNNLQENGNNEKLNNSTAKFPRSLFDKVKKILREKTSLRTVMIIIVLITTMIVLLLTSALMLSRYNQTIEDSAKTTTAQAVSNISMSIDTFVQDRVETIDNIKNVVEEESEDEQKMYGDLQTIFDLRSDIVSIVLYDNQGNILYYVAGDDLVLKDNYQDNNQSFDVDINMVGVEYQISNPHVQNLFVQEYPWVVTMTTKAITSENELIYVTMDIEFSGISKYIDKVSIGSRGYVYVADEYGNIIYHPQQQLIFSNLKEENTAIIPTLVKEGTYVGNNNIYSTAYVEGADWYIIGMSSIEEMVTVNFNEYLNYILIIFGSGIVIATFLALILAKNLTSPIHGLMSEMAKFEENIENYKMPESNGFYEVRTLTKSFDHMAEKIKHLMEEVIAEEQELRKFELKALQAQINPHFLYNTLDSILWMCQQKGNTEAAEMVSALANFFRISISRGHDIITIEDEMKHVESYLVIQNIRYKNQFKYRFDVDKELLKYKCLKITLQPFVENAIYHGIDRMVDEGEIVISGKKEGDKIVLSVSDNGLGMTEEQVEALFIENSDKVGVGVQNVHNRIKIFFGDEYGISVQSELDEGTTIRVEFPISEVDEYAK
ncbi:MAG: sensor histidine kinase [Bacillota bacterium]